MKTCTTCVIFPPHPPSRVTEEEREKIRRKENTEGMIRGDRIWEGGGREEMGSDRTKRRETLGMVRRERRRDERGGEVRRNETVNETKQI